ncbi:hypothetical protein PILCRDRAFT_797325 [Piloderma croceum F 1598]|uniref:Berberine/berberine-like domain-containing protein n=1 Tax=Piloderma croceum (strain F 1598) TaxID=765440 RepID=A0A0C3F9U7_PILCF|nr:hypothetical protein PILCRDRAFT_797325 [Piloderma croceum F 1598]
MFNGNAKTKATVVVCPLDADKILLFCAKHSLSPSVKAGGYGIAGWAVGGDLIIDTSKFIGVDIERGYTSLRDIAPAGNKGGGHDRLRDNDDQLRFYDSASGAVAGVLHGAPLPPDALDVPSPSVRQRLDAGPSARSASGYISTESSSSGSMSNVAASSNPLLAPSAREQAFTDDASLSIPAGSSGVSPAVSALPSSGADPFGYMNLEPSPMYRAPSSSQSIYRSYGPTTGALFSGAGATPTHQHVYVSFGAGMRQKEIDRYTADHPLEAISSSGFSEVIPYHVPFSAHPVGSSIMLLGGFGFVDNLVEVEMVLADGRVVIVNETEYSDLFWAMRGGGPAFGVVIRYKAKAYPVPVVFAGNLIYRFHRATAPSLIKHFRDCVKGAPRELYANVLLTAGPAGKDSLVVIQICYLGPREEGRDYLQAISAWDGESCLLNEVHEKSFLHQQHRRWFIRSALITSLPDDIIHKTVFQFSTGPLGCTWLFELAGGAISDYEDTCIPKIQREARFTVAALHQWEIGIVDDRCRSAAEDWISGTLMSVNTGGPYPTFLGRHEPPARTMACFGPNWPRLVEIKHKYDPSGMFRNTFWPLDTHGQAIEPEQHEPSSP